MHLVVRGVADDGSDLVISRDYISHRPRSRAADLVSAELGRKPDHEIRSALEREVEAERWTRLEAAIRMAADDISLIDLRPDKPILRDLGVRGDIIKTMHRAFTGCGRDRDIADFVIDADTASLPIIGRLVATGPHDELTGQAYAGIDGVDGRAHHVGLNRYPKAPVMAPFALIPGCRGRPSANPATRSNRRPRGSAR